MMESLSKVVRRQPTKGAKLECFECHIQAHILFVTMISGPISVQTSSEILILARYSATASLNHLQCTGFSHKKKIHFVQYLAGHIGWLDKIEEVRGRPDKGEHQGDGVGQVHCQLMDIAPTPSCQILIFIYPYWSDIDFFYIYPYLSDTDFHLHIFKADIVIHLVGFQMRELAL